MTTAWVVPVSIVVGGVALWVGCGLATGRFAVENAHYTVVRRVASASGGSFEVRSTAAHTVAETRVASPEMDRAGSNAFRVLAGYIFGSNAGSEKIAMTSPVQLQPVSGAHVVSFVLPSRHSTLDSLPRPNDSRVTLRAVPRGLWAVRALPMSSPFARRLDAARFAVAVAALQRDVAAAGLRTAVADGAPVVMQLSYDPPWTPFFVARNEVALALDADASS